MCVTIHFGPMGAHFTFSPNQSKKKKKKLEQKPNQSKKNKNKTKQKKNKQTNKKTKTNKPKTKNKQNKTKPSGQNFASPTGTVGENDLKMHKDLAQCPTSIIKRITVNVRLSEFFKFLRQVSVRMGEYGHHHFKRNIEDI